MPISAPRRRERSRPRCTRTRTWRTGSIRCAAAIRLGSAAPFRACRTCLPVRGRSVSAWSVMPLLKAGASIRSIRRAFLPCWRWLRGPAMRCWISPPRRAARRCSWPRVWATRARSWPSTSTGAASSACGPISNAAAWRMPAAAWRTDAISDVRCRNDSTGCCWMRRAPPRRVFGLGILPPCATGRRARFERRRTSSAACCVRRSAA